MDQVTEVQKQSPPLCSELQLDHPDWRKSLLTQACCFANEALVDALLCKQRSKAALDAQLLVVSLLAQQGHPNHPSVICWSALDKAPSSRGVTGHASWVDGVLSTALQQITEG